MSLATVKTKQRAAGGDVCLMLAGRWQSAVKFKADEEEETGRGTARR